VVGKTISHHSILQKLDGGGMGKDGARRHSGASIPTSRSGTSSASPRSGFGRETVTYVINIYKYYVADRLMKAQQERRAAAKAEVGSPTP
jgi:hypothetical protein